MLIGQVAGLAEMWMEIRAKHGMASLELDTHEQRKQKRRKKCFNILRGESNRAILFMFKYIFDEKNYKTGNGDIRNRPKMNDTATFRVYNYMKTDPNSLPSEYQ